MTKTVKQIVDEYLNRQQNVEFESITFENSPSGQLESHSSVSNVFKDGVQVTELSLDSSYHEYKLDRKMEESIFGGRPEYWLRVTFRGRVVRISQKIEE